MKFAVIGIGCRFSGSANSPSEFFDNLLQSKDCITTIPTSTKWNSKYYYHPHGKSVPGKICTEKGGFMDYFQEFDNELFNMSVKEASNIDPQQKILLEVSHQALEDSNLNYRGSKTGVFIGTGQDSFSRQICSNVNYINQYTAPGSALSIHSNQISYRFDLRGPSMSVDSACSSSGNAMYLAMRAIEAGDCEQAVVGGINSVDHQMTVAFSKLGVLSKDGTCKPFDASANGYVRSEGCGIVIVKPFEKAVKDGDHIYCVILSTLSNEDGSSSPSLTLPSGEQQNKLIKEALNKANVNPLDVFYCELHGTGTPVGDPIETNEVGKIVGINRNSDYKVKIGSVKSNIGHTECASYVASLIKCCLMLDKKVLFPTIHYKSPNPKIKFEEYNLQVQTKTETFEDSEKIMLVSSFGFGGSNVATVIQGYSPSNEIIDDKKLVKLNSKPYLYILSAQTKDSLLKRIQNFKYDCEEKEDKDLELMYLANSQYKPYRYLSYGLLKSGENIKNCNFEDPSRIPDQKPKICIVFSGQGPQHYKMGRQLYTSFPKFREMIDKCDKMYKNITGISLVQDIGLFNPKYEDKGKENIVHKIEYTLPSLIFIQIALFELWKSFGIIPDVVMGHSFGEMCAVYSSGAASLETVISITAARAQLMKDLEDINKSNDTKRGSMLAIGATEEQVKELISKYDQLWIAAYNSPVSFTIGGIKDSIVKLSEECTKRKLFNRELAVTNAYHTPLLSCLRERAIEKFGDISGMGEGKPTIPLISTVTGDFWTDSFNSTYYWLNIENAVLFEKSVTKALDTFGENLIFLELAPHAVLNMSIKQILGSKYPTNSNVFYSLNRNEYEQSTVMKCLGQLATLGHNIDWGSVCFGHTQEAKNFQREIRTQFKLPTYPYQRTVCNFENEFAKEERERVLWDENNPKWLLGIKSDHTIPTFNNFISSSVFPFLHDHQIQDAIIFPGAGYVEIFLETIEGDNLGVKSIKNVEIKQAMSLPSTHHDSDSFVFVQTVVDINKIAIHSRREGIKHKWILNATAEKGLALQTIPKFSISDIRKRCNEKLEKTTIYERFKSLNLNYGQTFQCVKEIFRGDEECLGLLTVPPTDDYDYKFNIHPALLDCAFQTFLGTVKSCAHTYLPTSLARVDIYSSTSPLSSIFVYCKLNDINQEEFIAGDIYGIHTETGECLFLVKGLKCNVMKQAQLSTRAPSSCHWSLEWQSQSMIPLTNTFNHVLKDMIDSKVQNSFIPALLTKFITSTERAFRLLEINLTLDDSVIGELAPILKNYQQRIEYNYMTPNTDMCSKLQEQLQEFDCIRYHKLSKEDINFEKQGILKNSIDIAIIKGDLPTSIQPYLVDGGKVIIINPEKDQNLLSSILVGFENTLTLTINEKHSAVISNKVASLTPCLNCDQIKNIKEEVHIFDSDDCLTLLETIKKVDLQKTSKPLFIITRDSQLDYKSTKYSSIVGLGRVLINEYSTSKLKIKLIDFSSEEKNVDPWLSLVYSNIDLLEDELSIRDNVLYVPRIAKISEEQPTIERNRTLTPDQGFYLNIEKRGLLDTLYYQHFNFDHQNLKENEVLVRVYATSLNFKDVMLAMNMLQMKEFSLGLEFSGIVEKIGSGVTRFKKGDSVYGFGKNSIASHVITIDDLLVKKPKNLSFEEAASIPAVFITAYCGLMKRTGISNCYYSKEKPKVLIHSCAGGVGQAAVQICNWANWEVYATVGSKNKRQFLREKYGVNNFADSHSQDWDEEVMKLSKGGVDVVLNSLAGEHLLKGINVLKPYGTFIEIGKRDILNNSLVGLKPFEQNLTLASVHLDHMYNQIPKYVGQLMMEVNDLFANGTLTPIVDKIFYANEINDSFRFMQSGKHLGKIIINFREESKLPADTEIVKSQTQGIVLSSSKVYILSGGLGAVGFELMKFLATKGAKYFILLSRSGSTTNYQQREINKLLQEGYHIHISKTDVADESQVQRMFSTEMKEIKYPNQIGGIIHLAMVLDDVEARKMTKEQFLKVYIPKVEGAKNLMKFATDKTVLDFVVFFSSISAVIGNPEQGNYVAANNFLDCYAQYLTKYEGYKNVHSINLGAVSDVGVVANDFNLRRIMNARGISMSTTVREVCLSFEKMCLNRVTSLTTQHIPYFDCASVCKNYEKITPKFAHLIEYKYDNETDQCGKGDHITIEVLRKAVAKLLQTDENKIEEEENLTSYGVDSLLAVELSVLLKQKFNIQLSQMDILGGITLKQMMDKVGQ